MTDGAFPISRPRTALLLGNYRPSLVVARCLVAAAYDVIITLEGDEGGCDLSRFVSEVWHHSPLQDGDEAFLEDLDDLLDARPDIKVVFPISEEFVNLIAAAEWAPPAGVTLVGPGHDAVNTFSDKIESLHLAHRNGVRTLPYEVVSDHATLFKAAARIGFPITVRALGTTARLGHKKAIIAASPEELIEDLPEWPSDHDVLLLQQLAEGQRHNIYFAAQNGELIAAVASRIDVTNHPEGTGLAVYGQTIEPPPDLLRDTQTLLSQEGYHGIGLAQFIVDRENGERCFLELNPRVSGSHAVPEGARVPLSAMAVDLARGIDVEIPAHYLQGDVGLRYAWTSGAFMGAKMAYLRGEIRLRTAFGIAIQALRSAPLADIHFIWAWDDPKPAIRAFFVILPKFTRLRTALAALLPWRRDAVRTA